MPRLFPTVLSLFTAAIIGSIASLQAQDQKPTIWEERARETLKTMSRAQKLAVSQGQPSQSDLKKKQLKKPKRILAFWRSEDFIHTSIPTANFALQEMSRKTRAFTVELADDYSVFNKKKLKAFDGILFNNTTHLEFPQESQRQAIADFVNGGGALIGIHAAADNFYEWETGAAMIGGQFNGHPWTKDGTWAFKLDDSEHPLNAAFDGNGFWLKDEIYQYKPSTFQGLDALRVLVSLDTSKREVTAPLENPKNAEKFGKDYGPGPRQVPVSWIREIGKGRLFYTNFGHNESTYENKAIMQHVFEGILYALGYTELDATPTAQAGSLKTALAPTLEPAPAE